MTDKYIKRYTDIPALIYLLRESKITLLDPKSWDDSNDSHYLNLYRQKKKLSSVLALCFTQEDENYHHWRVFANGQSGVCIRFRRPDVIRAVGKKPGIRIGNMSYLTLNRMRGKRIKTDDLPFIKRYAFKHENEFRIIYESKTAAEPLLDVAIPLTSIERIILSPWVHKALVPHLKDMLHEIDGCEKMKIVRSTLIGNEEWKRLGEAAK